MPLTPRPHLDISAEVAVFLGPEALAQLYDDDVFTGYICPVCDGHGTLGALGHPAALVAWHYLPVDVTLVQYVHAACSPSTLLTINAHPSSGLDLIGRSMRTPRARNARLSAIQHAFSAGHAAVNAAKLKITRCSLAEGRDITGEKRAEWTT